jgi:hypothetical protein
MTSCVSCGAEVGTGRYCTSCGAPIDWRTDTAERPPPRPPAKLPPPAPADLPPAQRFPLYVDEVTAVLPPAHAAPPADPPVAAPVGPAPHRRPRGSWPAWLAVAVVLVLVAALGGWLATRSVGDGGDAGTGPVTEPSGSASTEPEPGVVVPDTAPPNQDVDGNPVRYDGQNLLDGDPETAWRMPGDGTGGEITVTLDAETRLRSVGIINGYAKTSDVDWYHGNRRVLQVEWVFDDGTTVVQDLEDTTELQTVDVDATTTQVVVRLLEVSPPGKGRTARDYTAISELAFG